MGLDIFYSQLHRVMSNAPDKVFGNGNQVKLWLQSNAARFGIKQDEIQWSGVTDWLDMQNGKVSKDAVLEYVRNNGVQVKEVMLGRDYNEDGSEKFRYSGETKYSSYKLPGGENYKELLLKLSVRDGVYVAPQELKALPDGYEAIFDLSQPEGLQWSVIPPGQVHARPYAGRHSAPEKAQEYALAVLNSERDNNARDEYREAQGGNTYRSGHFDQPNILAHVRFDERTDADGKRVLFIEEIQSDWAQEGRRKGFSEKYKPDDVTAIEPTEAEGGQPKLFWYFEVPGNVLQIPKSRYATQAEARQYILNEKSTRNGAPPKAPFVTNTEAWVSLAIKRMVRYAAENGFDKVAFINGEQAAGLYDLSKHIDRVDYNKTEDELYNLSAIKGNSEVFAKEDMTESELESVIGKEVASKIVKGEGEPVDGHYTLSGIDLKVGGEGMRGFYDQIVLNVANDVLKKLGGGRVEEFRLPQELDTQQYYDRLGFNKSDIRIERDGANWWSAVNKDGKYWDGGRWVDDEGKMRLFTSQPEVEASLLSRPQPGFVITPELRARVLNEGIPLFSKGQQEFPSGMPVAVVETEITRMRQQWLSMPRVSVVNDVSELPFAAPSHADGAYSNGHVYVVAGNIQDMKQLQKVLAHECVLHHSLQEMLGDYGFSKLHSGIQALKKAGDPVVTALAQNILGRYGELPPESETKEIIARAGEQCLDETGNVRIGYGFMKGVYAGVASWLRDQGFKVPFTNLELQGIMHNAGEWIQQDHARDNQGVKSLRGLVSSPILHSFAGARAEGAPLDTLARARGASAIGTGGDAKSIHQETGWFSGADGKWRFEISDAGARLTMDRLTSADFADLANDDTAGIELGQLMDHPALFSAYPELKTIWVIIDPNKDGASFRHGDNTLRIGYDKVAQAVNLSSLIHETQHAIQALEGFSRGGSPEEFKGLDITNKELDRINQEVHKLYAQNPDFYRDSVRATQLQISVKNKYGSTDGDIEDPLMKDWWAAIDKRDAHPEAAEWFSLKSMEYRVGKQRIVDSPEDQYHRLSGEVEARLTQTRMRMNQEERLAVFPLDAMDVPAKDQTVRFGDRRRAEVVADGSFSGRVLEVSGGVVLQKIGRAADAVVRHNMSRLSASVALGDVVDIKYLDGVGVVSGKGLAVGVER
jgi:hypothetical protein